MTLPLTGSAGPAVEAAGLEVAEIAEGLRAWARGFFPTEAAVELLIGHGSWLRRADFRELLWVQDDVVGLDPDELAGLAILAAGSSSELGMLKIAASLLGVDVDEPLARLLSGLDDRNRALVLEAVAHAGGWHERHHSHLVTGRFEGGGAAR